MKYTIIKNIAPLSEEEINSSKDFQSVIKRRNQHLSRARYRSQLYMKVFLSIVILSSLSLAIYFAQQISLKDVEKSDFSAPVDNPPKDFIGLLPEVTDTSSAKPTANNVDGIKENNLPNKRNAPPSDSNNSSELKEHKEHQNVQKSSTNRLVYAYEEAYPVDGIDSLYNYLNEAIKYPENVSLKDSIEGTSIVHFTISKEGMPTDISVSNSLGIEFDLECIRLIKNMPAWKPAKSNGKPVDSKMSVPISFSIQG